MNSDSQWTDEQRRAALDELAARFQTRLTEQEVFQAAALFLGLLRDGAFIDRGWIAQRVRQDCDLAARGADAVSGRRT